MGATEPQGELDARFSSEGATAVEWSVAEAGLENAELYWLSTVRPDGRPHVTPLLAAWFDGALYFCTGPQERKAKNLEHNQHCLLTTGCNALREGFDIVVEGDAVVVTDDARLRRFAAVVEAKYGSEWQFDVGNGTVKHEGGEALVFAVAPATIFGFGKGEPYTQTRWRL